MKLNRGKLRGAAKKIGGTFVSPPLNLSAVEQHFGHDKKFPDAAKQLDILENGAPANAQCNSTNLNRAL